MSGWLLAEASELSSTLANDSQGISSVSVFKHFIVDGGPITWFVLIPLSVVTVALVIHYLLTIRRGTQAPEQLAKMLAGAGRGGHVAQLAERVRQDDTMLGQAAYAGLLQSGAGQEASRAAIEGAVEERATKLLRKIEYLNVIGNISPMIGLLGTVYGMIQAFSTIRTSEGAMPKADELAGDIAVAMVTTFWGILIAIIALSAFALFRNRINTYATEVVKIVDGTVAMLKGPSAP